MRGRVAKRAVRYRLAISGIFQPGVKRAAIKIASVIGIRILIKHEFWRLRVKIKLSGWCGVFRFTCRTGILFGGKDLPKSGNWWGLCTL